jgi:NAD(P)-dependent dehydrogenase (short-subunit alcohol dehydrogenase family)
MRIADSRSLRDQHVLITGGSSGIGLALARQVVAAGARVSLIARDPGKLAAAQAAIQAGNPGAVVGVYPADVARQAEVIAALAQAEKAQGAVDVLITSAGVARPGYFEDLPVAVFEQTMAVNYFGTLYPLKSLVPAMRRRGRGAVVLMSSGAGLFGLFGYTSYCPSKFALRGLAEALRAELEGTGVRIMISARHRHADAGRRESRQADRNQGNHRRRRTVDGGCRRAVDAGRPRARTLQRDARPANDGAGLVAQRAGADAPLGVRPHRAPGESQGGAEIRPTLESVGIRPRSDPETSTLSLNQTRQLQNPSS